ncbi:MAG TPA: hypothetical protein VFQ41_02555 [Candidatus Angelobacter sp.]|nr:hypothetical protein [Candidatus Angelobacter sp.]
MKLCWVLSLALGLLAYAPSASAVDGTFRGKITDPPANQPAVKGWIFVQGRNRMLRRVEVAHAEIVYGEEVPASEHHTCNADCLKAGQEVRITAHQDSSGEWRAKRVEILALTMPSAQTHLKTASLPNFTYFPSQCQVTSTNESCIARSTGEI